MVRHLSKLGYTNVYNKCEDFYEVIDKGKVPSHDVLLTNPPYSGDHFDKLLGFLSGNNKPALLLLPEHFSNNKSSLYSPDKFCFLSPPERYHYWTPDGMRPEPEPQQKQQPDEKKKKKRKKQHRNLVLGSRNSPFASHWFICMDPIVTNDAFVSLVNNNDGGEITLVEGCRIHNKQESILPTKFKGLIQNNGEEDNGAKKKKKRSRRNKEKTADSIEQESS